MFFPGRKWTYTHINWTHAVQFRYALVQVVAFRQITALLSPLLQLSWSFCLHRKKTNYPQLSNYIHILIHILMNLTSFCQRVGTVSRSSSQRWFHTWDIRQEQRITVYLSEVEILRSVIYRWRIKNFWGCLIFSQRRQAGSFYALSYAPSSCNRYFWTV